MTPNPPLFASRLQPHIPPALADLTERSRRRLTDADKHEGVKLLADSLCDLLDTVFTRLLEDIDAHYRDRMNGKQPRMIQEAHRSIEDIKGKIHHYLGWVVKFLANDRLIPVIGHYNDLVHELPHVADDTFVVFTVPPALGHRAARVIGGMKDGSITQADEGIELLIQFIDVSIDPLAKTPMKLMRFNFVVNKTLNGVIHLILTMVKRMLRKLPAKLPPELLPLLADHMGSFLIIEWPDNTALPGDLAPA